MYTYIYIYIRPKKGALVVIRVGVLLSFQQPTFQENTTTMIFSCAHVVSLFVPSDILKCGLLK